MEEKMILQVVINSNDQIAILMGEASADISPATLVGVLEQVKMSIFDNMKVTRIDNPKTYDA